MTNLPSLSQRGVSRRLRVTVRNSEGITRFTRRTTRSLNREIKLLNIEFPEAKSISFEIISEGRTQ